MASRSWSLVVVALCVVAVPVWAQAPSAESPDKKLVARAGGKMVVVNDVAAQKTLLVLKGHTGTITAVTFSPDGKQIATGGEDSVVNLWDIASGMQLQVLRPGAAVKSVVFSPDGRTLTVETKDKKTLVFDAATGKQIKDMK